MKNPPPKGKPMKNLPGEGNHELLPAGILVPQSYSIKWEFGDSIERVIKDFSSRGMSEYEIIGVLEEAKLNILDRICEE
jgi:hypothetical protein